MISYITHDFWFVRFSQELIFLLDLKEWKHLKLSTRTKEKIFLYFYLLILWLFYVLHVNTYLMLYQTASLANIFFSAALTTNDIKKVSALFSLFWINKKRIYTDISSRCNSFHKNWQWKFYSRGMNYRRCKLDGWYIEFISFLPLKTLDIVLEC